VRGNGLRWGNRAQNFGVKPGNGTRNGMAHAKPPVVSVLVAVQAAPVREALVAMLGAIEGFSVVGEASNDDQALDLARRLRPHLALVQLELSGCCGWWLIQRLQREQLARVVVALGSRSDNAAATQAGAHAYIQMGTAPRELLRAVEAAIALVDSASTSGSGAGAEAEQHLLPNPHAVR
jgi:DNA-binding NarL/FixJ family response regulator